ncbi:aminotransferase class IV [Flavobacterium oreochromis]|uniref:branched-chain-amino-acid transaminase n=1 Tax=Flavobacterium oreochromis TaxID=2906078 RepID=A0ABW8P970_9FLAO|nr:aminotransferase class IV [Flavobacterium oreochromis]OWP77022.1 aminotransferase class IV [Flavobacterium oreochromis]POR28857.1 aminotransferase class IV [Flavobacterium columnare]QYS85391.1 aminotransferase class IV [Flavobacterium oreochromis]
MDIFSTLQDNRAFLYGDAVFETLKVLDNKVLFLEDHYFRLMASMRILRMEIPLRFTLEYFENQILKTVKELNIEKSARVRFNVFRKNGGLYLPQTNEVDYFATAISSENTIYTITNNTYEVDIYKDFVITKQLLSTIKSTNRTINITGSIYANENNLDNCLLLNHEKNVIEALNGNIFMVKDDTLITPPLSEGCINGVMRKQLLTIAQHIESLKIEERPISSFELQKADELFITNVIKGIQPITKYRKKDYKTSTSELLTSKLNIKIRLD